MLTLKKNHEFQKVFKKGSWYNSSLLNVYIMKNNKKANYIGIAVGKKVAKSSVKRNRIRRLIREAYRLNEKKTINGLDIIIVWKTNCSYELATFKDIQNDLMYCFKKANVINTDELNEEDC